MTALGDVLHLLFTANLWQATLAAAVLLLLPALGGVISERSGVVNIAMEGMMLTGAFFGVAADLAWHNVWLATGVAILAGGLMAVIHAVVSIQFRADQIVSGIAINIFAAGLTVFLVNRVYGLQDVGLRAVLPSDSYLLYRLYNLATPETTRRVEAATFNEWHAAQERQWLKNGTQLLQERDGQACAWAGAARLPHGVALDLLLDTTATGQTAAIVAAAARTVATNPAATPA